MPVEEGNFHMQMVMTEDTLPKIVNDTLDILEKKYGILPDEVQILTPINGWSQAGPGEQPVKRMSGQLYLNDMLRAELNPDGEVCPHTKFRTGDKVINVKNNYKVITGPIMNGEIGFVAGSLINTDASDKSGWFDEDKPILAIDFEMQDDRSAFLEADCENLYLAYAMTIHKSQGSQFKAVIAVFPRVQQDFTLRQLVYTAVSRGKEQVYVISVGAAFQKFIENTKRIRRISLLSKFLKGE